MSIGPEDWAYAPWSTRFGINPIIPKDGTARRSELVRFLLAIGQSANEMIK
jgi:hypothetical protein